MEPPPLDPYAPPRGTAAPDAAVAPLTDDEIAAFVGVNDDYYKERWARANGGGRFYAGFNWAAAVVTSLWLLHRRMYLEFAVVTAIGFLTGPVLTTLVFLLGGHWTLQANVNAMLVCSVGYGFLGNALYLRRARAAAEEARAHVDPALRQQLLQRRGGTSVVAVFVGIAALLLLLAAAGALGRAARRALLPALLTSIEHETIAACDDACS
jgi:hypothetical protein